MEAFLVDNRAGLITNEKSVLDVFREHIKTAIEKSEKISFRVAVGFFFFDGFQKLYPILKELHEKNLLAEFKVVMGPETKRQTKEVLEALRNDATILNDETFEFIKKLYDEGKFDFRIFLKRGFHPKLYLFGFEKSGLEIWAGSANLTEGGLEENVELVVPVAAPTLAERELFEIFFDELWKRSTDEVENLRVIDVVREASTSEFIHLAPRDFIVNLLKIWGKEYLVENIGPDLSYLVEFQHMSYYLALEKMRTYGGCVLANSVGLGKTDVACRVAKRYRDQGKKVLIIYPPVIEKHWKKTAEKIGLGKKDVKFLSRGVLHKSDFNYENYQGIDLVIVDEAHAFRISKPKSNRRENLENIAKINPSSHILLVTATPINTSILDFVELVKLFAKGPYKERFEREGLMAKMKWLERAAREGELDKKTINMLNDLVKTFSIRIDWMDIMKFFRRDMKRISGVDRVEPPDVFPVRYNYDEEIAKKIFDRVVPFLERLNFEYTKLWEKEYKEDKNLIWWYRWRLYKRLESSLIAFEESLKKMLSRNRSVKNFLNKLLERTRSARFSGEIERGEEEEELEFSKERIENIKNTFLQLPEKKKERVLKKINDDISTIEKMLQRIETIEKLEERDEKITKLFSILKEENKPALIFSESVDTVEYIGRRLRACGEFKHELAHSKITTDKEVIEKKFQNKEFDILVSTDVMGEGVNLPRADVVVNFDLPYNPVRLIQRDGRAIRITEPKKIRIYNFVPDDRINKELELCERLAERVENILSSIGLDFIIWSIEQGKIDKFTERNRKRTIELIKEFKYLLASKTPEEVKGRIPPTLSQEDKALREFIKAWNISEETLRYLHRRYTKPIATSLKLRDGGGYFIVFDYRGNAYSLGELKFSDVPLGKKMDRSDALKVKSLVSEKCMELDREFFTIARERDRVSTQIENLLEKEEELRILVGKYDIHTLPRKDKQEILKLLQKIIKQPPWKKEQVINELKGTLESKRYTYQRSLAEPKILAVVKYG